MFRNAADHRVPSSSPMFSTISSIDQYLTGSEKECIIIMGYVLLILIQCGYRIASLEGKGKWEWSTGTVRSTEDIEDIAETRTSKMAARFTNRNEIHVLDANSGRIPTLWIDGHTIGSKMRIDVSCRANRQHCTFSGSAVMCRNQRAEIAGIWYYGLLLLFYYIDWDWIQNQTQLRIGYSWLWLNCWN